MCMPRNPNSFLLVLVLCLLGPVLGARAYTAKDADAMAVAYNNAFYSLSGTNGWFKDTQTGGVAYFWGQAEMIECAIDAYEWTSNATYKGMITNLLNGFLKNNGSSWSWNIYNDDIMWAVLAFARGGRDTGNLNYCNIARANFDMCYARAWDNTLGGGLYWTTGNWTKNACVNGPGSIAASLLYQIYGDPAYLSKATDAYNWERAVLFNTNSGAISDAIGTNGVINTWASTYNQGTFIGAAHFLGRTNDAALAANYTMMKMTTGGILPEYGIAGNNSGFNAIFLRWLVRFMRDRNLQGTYGPWLQRNAEAAWNLRRPTDNLSWCQWLHPSPAGTNFYAWDCISSFEIMLAAEPTQDAALQALPANFIGAWPLDATTGTVAADLSANHNDGAVAGAAWTSAGLIGGCLTFNGVNSSVQVSNPAAADFSIALWVKTTQTAGTGQWYNGRGLVDGDAPFSSNDFGTALVGGKFAFGVGNPDTTLLSATAINNGNWHHCVATRQRDTGTIKVYVDGVLQATGSANKNVLNASGQLLFGAIASGGGYFNGSLDDIRIFPRVLDASEVAALYVCGIQPPSTAPANLRAVAGNGQVELTWSAAAGATSYNVKRSLIDGSPYIVVTNLAATTCTDAGLINNRTYYYVVSPVNSLGEGPDSDQASATPVARAAWFQASDLAALADGASVGIWPDASGHGFDALQPVTVNQPTFAATAVNGMPAVRFNATNNSYLWFYRPVQDDFTMIFVYQSSQGIGTGTAFWNGAGLVNGEVSGSVGDFGTALNANGQILAGVGNPDTTIHSATGLSNGQPHVITFKRTRSNGVIVLYVDSTPAGSASGGTQSLTAPNCLVLGAQGVLNNFLTGDLAEVQIYNAALSDADRLGQERALKCKYGIAGGAAPLPPGGLAGTAGNRQIALNWQASPGAEGCNLWRSTDYGASYQLIAAGLTTSSYVDHEAAGGQMNYYRLTASNDCGTGVNSAPLGVFLPLPSLSLTASAGALNLTWPDWASDWELYSTTNLTPPVQWNPVTSTVTSNNGRFSVSLPVDSQTRFFRLAAPQEPW